MTAFPPRDRLDALLSDLSRHLPESQATILASPELARGRAALAELADAECRERVVGELDPAEAAWIADIIEARWSRLGGVRREPAACIVAPDELWVIGATAALEVAVAVLDMAPDWRVKWPPDADVGEGGCTARYHVGPPQPGGPATVALLVKVIGRAAGPAEDGGPGGRVVLHARKVIAIRRPLLRLDAARTTLEIRDQAGRPAAGLVLTIDGIEQTVAADGMLRFTTPLGPSPAVTIGGEHVAVDTAG